MSALARILGILGAGGSRPLAEGAALPDVSQANQDGRVLRLAETGAAGWLLVYFYPKAGTPNCTRQACGLRDAFEDLAARGVRVIGVSGDPPRAQKAFHEKHRLPFDLLADADGAVARAFGVPRTFGLPKRQAFLFKDGRLVWRDLAASAARQAQDALSAMEALR